MTNATTRCCPWPWSTPTTDRYVFTVTNKGQGKRTEVQRYRVQGRGGSGIITHSLREGEVLAGALVAHYENTEVLLMSDAGTVIRMDAAEFRQQSRSTQGVNVMRTGEANVIGLALVVENDDEDDESTPSLAEMAGIDPSEDGATPPDVVRRRRVRRPRCVRSLRRGRAGRHGWLIPASHRRGRSPGVAANAAVDSAHPRSPPPSQE